MEWIYDDGGRSKYFKAERVGDCVTRAIAIATGMDYKEVYDLINAECKVTKLPKKRRSDTNRARDGVYRKTYQKVLERLGWEWIPTMKVGVGCETHMNADELPTGTIIVKLTKHLVCVKDGVIHDTYNSSIKQYYDSNGTLVTNEHRCVYGYYKKAK